VDLGVFKAKPYTYKILCLLTFDRWKTIIQLRKKTTMLMYHLIHAAQRRN